MSETRSSDFGHLAHPGTFRIYDDDLESRDPLEWPEYPGRLEEARASSGTTEAVIAGNAVIATHRIELAEFNFGFMGGSMGEIAGERLARSLERAGRRRVPFVLRTATGGARMQEGMQSLVQMPKVVLARRTLAAAGQPLIAILGHPTTGGVLASIAGLADVTIAEADATIGFAGPRLVQAQTGKLLREGSHTAEAALAAGLVDVVVHPDEVVAELTRVLDIFDADSPDPLREPIEIKEQGEYDPGGWIAVDLARLPSRPNGPQLVRDLCDLSFFLNGDRAGTEDPAIGAALGRIRGRRALVLAFDRRRRPGPAAYRKAIRALDIAARNRLPVVTLIDTPGADASEDSEARGIAWAIAATLDRMLSTSVPIVSFLIGEGGSGGALALATGDVLLAFEHAVFSVIAPELAAEILWKDAERHSEAADLLKLDAFQLLKMGIADALLPEPVIAESIAEAFAYHLDRLDEYPSDRLMSERHKKWRRFG